MQNIKVGTIPIRQTIKINTRGLRIKKFLKKYKIGLIVGISITLLSIYSALIINFIKLLKYVC